jgi:hypothetical protein
MRLGTYSWARGARVFEIRAGSKEMPTWIRMEDGSVTDSVTLGKDYGK